MVVLHVNGPQAAVIEFLAGSDAYPPGTGDVDIKQTHAALVFLAGGMAYKIKKAVKFAYLDFSTLAKRKAACERELQINQPHAPEIYLAVVPIVRMPDGRLQIGGDGEPVEWAVHMKRFADAALLANAITMADLDLAFYDDLAIEIARYHAAAPVIAQTNGAARLATIIDEVCQALSAAPDIIPQNRSKPFAAALHRRHEAVRHRLDQRSRRGYVRRCHGDLHLANIVVLDAKPVLFDAIEFNEDIATIDVLYDLAFLIMDLELRHMRTEANRVLNRYLQASGNGANIAALQALPVFMACRAAIRAMVAITRLRQAGERKAVSCIRSEAADYVAAAAGFLKHRPLQLVCVAGLSGTGKTTVARQLAPLIGRAPGAVHLRSDVERKMMFGVAETERLPPSTYTPQASRRIYARLMRKAELALRAGHSVIVDAVFLNAGERLHVQSVAQRTSAGFIGLWLEADEAVLIDRVTSRRADASDATAQVVRKQLAMPSGPLTWHRVDAGGTPAHTVDLCRRIILP